MEYLRKSESVGVFGRRIISPEKQEQIASLHGLARIETLCLPRRAQSGIVAPGFTGWRGLKQKKYYVPPIDSPVAPAFTGWRGLKR